MAIYSFSIIYSYCINPILFGNFRSIAEATINVHHRHDDVVACGREWSAYFLRYPEDEVFPLPYARIHIIARYVIPQSITDKESKGVWLNRQF